MSLNAQLIATLVASSDHESMLVQIADDAKASAFDVDWLAPNRALDIAIENQEEQDKLRSIISGKPVDFAIQPQEKRRKKLLIADMDSTMIRQECLDELADFAGFGEKVAAITERAMAGEIAFEPALRERVALLSGLPVSTVEKVLNERIQITPGAKILVNTMRQNGAFTALVSGGFTAFTGPISQEIGFDTHHSNRLVENLGNFTGELHDPIAGPDTKLERLTHYCGERGIDFSETIAVGDGANDIPMAKAAGFSASYYGKPALDDVTNTTIRHTDLTALLYFQGYRQDELVS